MHTLQVLSFFETKMIGELHAEALCLMTHFSNNSCDCFFSSSNSNMDCLYSPIFGKGEFDYNCILCSTSLYACKSSSNWRFCSFDTSFKWYLHTCEIGVFLSLSQEKKYILLGWVDQSLSLVCTHQRDLRLPLVCIHDKWFTILD